MNKVYQHIVKVTIGDTNMEGPVYWLNYLKWFGQARELFMLHFMEPLIPKELSAPEFFQKIGVKIITLNAQMEFKHPAQFGDELAVNIQSRNFHESRVEVVCEIINLRNGQIMATGTQGLAFKNLADKIIRMPDEIRALAKEYEVTQ